MYRAITFLHILFFFVYVVGSDIIQRHDKWIVVTTIQYPTSAVQKLAHLPGWRLVVVADKKTPSDWHLDNCVFLSVEDQQKLPYRIIKHLPWNHYSRKNIGYLYAIEHGASIIYETDDDNILLSNEIPYLPEKRVGAQYVTHPGVINPYAHFGKPEVWPRGYPLTFINNPPAYHLIQKNLSTPIQQGLVNSDPDVDAIFRLTHKAEIFFDTQKSEVSLPAGTLCPFNSQNTIYHYNAFWGLVLPITTSFRVCDIWRSYWVQRMLWEIGATLCFLPPFAIQYRNAHNLQKDFEDELDLYLKTEKLISLLNQWQRSEEDLATCIQDLMQLLIDKGFFRPAEIEFLQAWLEDLSLIHYKMPAII